MTYFKGEEILACQEAGITAIVPKPLTSGSKAEGRFGKQDFIYEADVDEYGCPAGQRLIKHDDRGWPDAALLLVLGVPGLPHEEAMYDRQAAAH